MRSTLIFYTANEVCHQGAGSVFGSFLGARTEGPRAGQCAATVRARSGGATRVSQVRVALVYDFETLRCTSVASSYCRCILKRYMIYHFFP